MPTPSFKRVTLEQFEQLLAKFPFSRRINAVHMHHTWRPDRSAFRGHETIVSMWRYHTAQMGWRDIAQHITIDPEGFIWLGRNWNLPPASAAGHNGNANHGPFMFEMIGNFDKGHDPFDGAQRETALNVVALLQLRFNLVPTTLLFHNAMSSKSCPGSNLDYPAILDEVAARRTAIQERQASQGIRAAPFPGTEDAALSEAIEALRRKPLDLIEPADAELSHRELVSDLEEAAREAVLSPAALAALRPHIVNLSMGRFSNDGQATTSAADVDAIFEQHLAGELDKAREEGRKLRLVFYAHGGLKSESDGLRIAARHIDWWKQNRIYPIYFIWETGLFETIGSLLKRAQTRAARALPRDLWDYTLDPLIEEAVRTLKGKQIWGAMKSSAERAVDKPSGTQSGGARYVAGKLKEFCDKHGDAVELHAVGHSAGAVFHAHFLRCAHELGVPTFATAHFLAPAVRVDTFRELMGNGIGDNKQAKKLTIFTMKKEFEKADDCAGVYHKSLLYLIHNALEEERKTPILGLEESLRGDPALKDLFGLGVQATSPGEVVWSVTLSDTGRSASTSRTHGGFDNDASTMNSLARRILDKADADPIAEYRVERDMRLAGADWTNEVDWPEALGAPLPHTVSAVAAIPAPQAWAAEPARILHALPPGAGRRLALCVGINRYPDPDHQLAGCVADARMWAESLGKLGFTATLLLDEQASREGIARALMALVSESKAGDVIVFQYSGHGTTMPDMNGDDEDGKDEALCPYDFASGALYIDDDIAEVVDQLPNGVNLTCFMDCCHSGSNTRFAVGSPSAVPRPGRDERKRYIKPNTQLIEAHKSFRQKMRRTQRAPGIGGRSLMRDVKFAACLDSEVAWESDGHGEFTVRATRILAAGIGGLSNEQFLRRITSDFGVATRQHPMLDCALGYGSRPLLQPLSGNGTTVAPEIAAAAAMNAAQSGADQATLQQTLQQTLAVMQQLIAQMPVK